MWGHLMLSLLAMAIIATAQQASVAPRPASFPSYTKHKTKLYICGGDTGLPRDPDGQFFALDLSKPWRSTSPAWSTLQRGCSHSNTGLTVSLDGKILYTAHNIAGSSLFNFDTKNWTLSNAKYPNALLVAKPVTLGTDGAVFIAGGSPYAMHEYRTYSFVRDEAVLTTIPFKALKLGIPVFHEAVWSEHFKSAVIFGGFTPELPGRIGHYFNNNGTVIFFHAEKKSWSWMETTGVNSAVGSGFCLAITDDGKKLLSYGGIFEPPNESNPVSSSLYILDLTTGVWTEVADSGLKRAYSACTVAGDYFLLWGGKDTVSIYDAGKPSTPVSIYQISSNLWVQEYKPSADYLPPGLNTPSSSAAGSAPTSSPNPRDNPKKDEDPSAKVNVGAIAGGTAGGAVVIVLVGFFVWRRKKQRAGQSRTHDSTLDIDQHSAATDKTRSGSKNSARRMPQTSFPVDTYHSRQNAGYPDYTVDEASDNRYYDRDGYMYPTERNTSSHTPPPHYRSRGVRYTTGTPQQYGTTPTYLSDTMTSSQPISSRPTSPPVSPYGYELPSNSSPPSQSSKRRPRGPHKLDHKHMVREHFYAPDGRRMEDRPGPHAVLPNVAEST